ncbi:hypothetical protein [Paenibacillus silviterrae]|uniref:hypothetical protein n=1 Tax=Paenibacillus silviterrae TaxID=3242194 RepID=UPI002543A14A|nr:hypothetical protein [Paenibacillus chinjuensis]
MLTDEQLDAFRVAGTLVRVIRDADLANDVKGYVVAWDDQSMLIRRPNRRVLKLNRSYYVQPFAEPRAELWTPQGE